MSPASCATPRARWRATPGSLARPDAGSGGRSGRFSPRSATTLATIFETSRGSRAPAARNDRPGNGTSPLSKSPARRPRRVLRDRGGSRRPPFCRRPAAHPRRGRAQVPATPAPVREPPPTPGGRAQGDEHLHRILRRLSPLRSRGSDPRRRLPGLHARSCALGPRPRNGSRPRLPRIRIPGTGTSPDRRQRPGRKHRLDPHSRETRLPPLAPGTRQHPLLPVPRTSIRSRDAFDRSRIGAPVDLKLVERDGKRYLEGAAGQALMRDAADATQLVEACFNGRTKRLLLYPENLTGGFFDLSSREAG